MKFVGDAESESVIVKRFEFIFLIFRLVVLIDVCAAFWIWFI